MNAATANHAPAQRCVRISRGLTALAIVVVVLLVTLPTAWLPGTEWVLFIAFLLLAGGALVLAVAACIVRGADQAVGTAMVLMGLNIVVTLSVVVALFNFRMGAP